MTFARADLQRDAGAASASCGNQPGILTEKQWLFVSSMFEESAVSTRVSIGPC